MRAHRETKAIITEKEMRAVEFIKIHTLTHARTNNGEAQGYIEVVYTYADAAMCMHVETELKTKFCIARKGLHMLRGGSAFLSTNALVPTGSRALKLFGSRGWRL